MNHYEMSINRHLIEVPITANATDLAAYVAGRAEKIIGISVVAMTAPTSSSGTYLLTVGKGATAATNILASTNFDLETLVSGVRSEMSLSTTAGVLELAEGDVVQVKAVSNNADLVVTGKRLGVLIETVVS